jgi:hypothetical protein
MASDTMRDEEYTVLPAVSFNDPGSRNYPDHQWRIVCDDREGSWPGGPNDHTYPNRDAVISDEQATELEREDLRLRLQEIVDGFAEQLNAVTDLMLDAVVNQAVKP